MADGGHHGKGQHDEGDVTVPAVPGTRLVMIEAELVLRCLEAIFNRPPAAFDLEERAD